jgi:SpoVK/Ycf46/Vps4 family AAA+-type ATPase
MSEKKRKTVKLSEDKKLEEYLIKKHERIIERLSRDVQIGKYTINDIRKKYMENVEQPEYPSLGVEVTEEDNLELEEFQTDRYTDDISIIELAVINSFLYDTYRKKVKTDITLDSYGQTDSIGRIDFNGPFDNTESFWFKGSIKDVENDFIFQTKIYVDGRGELVMQLHISCKQSMDETKLFNIFKDIKKIAFNNSEYVGKCIKVKLRDYRFKGIEIIDIQESSNELILNDVQRKFIEHFVSRVSRGGNARYLLNGEPGTGKTESIREMCRKLVPNVTFIIPDFTHADDLTMIMESCEIFENAVIIMDDIDLYLGSRDNGSYTRLLGQFLSFFDGVKKRKISLLASTNDKGLVDKAAERPGRFNFTLDYSFLDDEQIVKVCDIHLPEKWRVKDVYDALTGTINGKKAKITGAFIANLADNIREMSEDDENWGIEDTVSLITESYKGFYSSQVEKEKSSMGFIR